MINFCKIGVLSLFLFLAQSYAQTKPHLSVHVLDSITGFNGPNIKCKLYKKIDTNSYNLLSTRLTDHDGRVDFLSSEDFDEGIYRVWFDTKTYYTNLGVVSFLPAVQITWKNSNRLTDYHIPVAISPFGFGTYRGN